MCSMNQVYYNMSFQSFLVWIYVCVLQSLSNSYICSLLRGCEIASDRASDRFSGDATEELLELTLSSSICFSDSLPSSRMIIVSLLSSSRMLCSSISLKFMDNRFLHQLCNISRHSHFAIYKAKHIVTCYISQRSS